MAEGSQAQDWCEWCLKQLTNENTMEIDMEPKLSKYDQTVYVESMHEYPSDKASLKDKGN